MKYPVASLMGEKSRWCRQERSGYESLLSALLSLFWASLIFLFFFTEGFS